MATKMFTTKPNSMKTSQLGEIKDITTNVTLFEKRILQLRVSWQDTLSNSTSYNVIVSSVNITQCPDLPCSMYGVVKPQVALIIPENPMSYVDVMECNYMFGCNYTLTVETSNAIVSKTTTVAIPYCVMDQCSCQHAPTLPKVVIVANIPSNDTINFHWSLKMSKAETKQQIATAWEKMKLWRIYLKISEQTNPSLSWGGKLIPIAENLYDLNNMSYIKAKDTLQGSVKIDIETELSAKAVLNLHAYVVDELRCPGPSNLLKVQVPTNDEMAAALMQEDINLRVTLFLISALFVGVIAGGMTYCVWRRRKDKAKAELMKNAPYLSPFAVDVEMEDNINYVDKYVEEAQARGLADVFEVPQHAIHIGPEIGEGAFGRVYKAVAVNLRRMRGNTVVAVKQLKSQPSADEVAEFLSEIEMLKGVGTHNNIVCFLGCCTIRPPYLMIMEFVGRGDLLTYLRTVRYESTKFKPKNANSTTQKPAAPKPSVKYIELKISTQSVDSEAEVEQRQQKPSIAETTYTIIDDDEFREDNFEYILDNKELHNFALQIANGMRYLEEQEVTHRDLAARNVLIDDRKTLKISDFGLSRHGIYTNTKTRRLPLRWLSIEAIRDNIYSSKSDVWAYGVVLWEIGTLGASPYPHIANHELVSYLLKGKRLEKPDICTEQVYAIMLQCWQEDPNERPTFDQLYKAMSPKTAYVDVNSLSDDYVFPPIKEKDNTDT